MTTKTSHVPTKGRDAIEILTNDHDTIKGLLQQLCDSSDESDQMQLLDKLKGLFTVHNATEENLIYPALREIARKKAESQHLVNETAEADLLVFQLDTMLKEGNIEKFQSTAKKLQAAVLEHIRDEEEKAFPHLQDGATEEQAQMLDDSVQKLREALQFTA